MTGKSARPTDLPVLQFCKLRLSSKRVYPTNQIVLPICCKAQTPSLALDRLG